MEAVPVGSITHILGSDGFAISTLSKVNDLENVVSKIAGANNCPSVSAISLNNHLGLSEKYGSAYVNNVLAKLFATMRWGLPLGTMIGQIAPTVFAAVAPDGEQFDDDQINEIITSVETEFSQFPN